jgi:uncharacterized protein (UPF0276 family)
LSFRETRGTANPIPARAGIGLRAPHCRELVESRPDAGWLEVHSENYFGDGGAPLHYLERAREQYPVSLHGVGLSVGSADPLDRDHLHKLKRLVDRIEPGLVSEHLCWSSIDGRCLNELLPLPYTEEALDHVVARIVELQDFLGRRILIENISSYLQYRHSVMPEWEFLAAIAERADCGLLLDVNNIYVNARNHGFDPLAYLSAVPAVRVREIHLAGHTINRHDDGEILIDTHSSRVCDDVWTLYRAAIAHLGARPTLIEWDSEIPELSVLLEEARSAQRIMEHAHEDAAV